MGVFRELFFFSLSKTVGWGKKKGDTDNHPSRVAHGPSEEAALCPMAPGKLLRLVIGKCGLLMEFCGC